MRILRFHLIRRSKSTISLNPPLKSLSPTRRPNGKDKALANRRLIEPRAASSGPRKASSSKQYRLQDPLEAVLRDRQSRVVDSQVETRSDKDPWSPFKMLSSIEIVTTPTSDTPGTALFLCFGDKTYLIGNIHEGLTRALIQRGIKLTKVTDIFITGRTEWKGIGGLLGTVLSAADSRASAAADATARARKQAAILRERGITLEAKIEKGCQGQFRGLALIKQSNEGQHGEDRDGSAISTLMIHGGPNLTHSLAAARGFIFRTGMPIRVDEYVESKARQELDRDWKPDWVDARVQVWKMAIAPAGNGEPGSLPDPDSPLKRRYEDFMEEESCPSGGTDQRPCLASADASADLSAESQRIRALVLSHMFDSTWRRDQLEEVPLADVKMPAKIFTRNEVTQKIEPYNGPKPDGTNPVPHINVLVSKPWPGLSIEKLPSTRPSQIAMSYVFRNHRQRGKFQPEKARLLKVPSGPLWRQLTEGQSVQSTDGQTITPDMVLFDAREGSGVAVVDLPSHEYVHNLVRRPEWQAPAVMNGVEMIIWILGPGVGQNEELQKFMGQYGHLKHSISSQDYCPDIISFDSAASGAIRLHQINPVNFPIPVHDNVPLARFGQSQQGQTDDIEFIPAKRGLKLTLTPNVVLNKPPPVPLLDTARVLHETPSDVLKLAVKARETIKSESGRKETFRQDLPSPDAEIVCLGTGSASPSKYRNVSSTLLRVPGCGSYLLDCGENTLGQLKRIYRPKQLSELFRDLKLIWISHPHADHHLGLPSVIRAWYEEVHGSKAGDSQVPKPLAINTGADATPWMSPLKDTLILVSSQRLDKFLQEYSEVEDFGFRHLTRFYSIGRSLDRDYTVLQHPDNPDNIKELRREALMYAGITDFEACYVSHCKEAQAVSLTFPTGFKFSYSGDCRPSTTFTTIGQGSTVLLHEATFDDELIRDAKAKKHSTTSEAIGVGVAMGARRILLTHFSQRYQKLPVISKVEGLDTKLAEEMEVSDEIEETDADIALPESNKAELDVNIPRSLTDAGRELATTEVGSKTPQTPPEANVFSAKQALPADLKIGVAFDYMRVKVDEIIHLEKFTPALLKLFEKAELDERVGLQEEALNDKDDGIVGDTLGAKSRKSKAGKEAGKEAGKKAEKKAIKKARRQATVERNSDDGPTVPMSLEADGPVAAQAGQR